MTLQHVRHTTALSYLELPVNIRSQNGYPTVYQQAEDIEVNLRFVGAYLMVQLQILVPA